MKKNKLIIIYAVLIFIFLILYLSLDNKKIYNTEDLVGKKMNEVDLLYFESEGTFNTREIFKNKFVLFNFWASWCAPCRKEHKNLIRLSKNKNLEIIGVNFKDSPQSAKKFLEELGNPFSILAKDPDGKQSINFGIYGIPETILIDKDSNIVKKYVGPLNLKDVNEIRSIVKK